MPQPAHSCLCTMVQINATSDCTLLPVCHGIHLSHIGLHTPACVPLYKSILHRIAHFCLCALVLIDATRNAHACLCTTGQIHAPSDCTPLLVRMGTNRCHEMNTPAWVQWYKMNATSDCAMLFVRSGIDRCHIGLHTAACALMDATDCTWMLVWHCAKQCHIKMQTPPVPWVLIDATSVCTLLPVCKKGDRDIAMHMVSLLCSLVYINVLYAVNDGAGPWGVIPRAFGFLSIK
ncbi:hypothetical protein NDU88_005152 [Pleurodeles waltl]|uniref:Uncharacterized protein n=1 Tax=Pleurodeles waltl TaxID=8319 RepID=A0AAV7KZW3_PLEWA|nr:hypothetical protein NDU88_005152 [Pleurodeles waltl]